jgi:hypothetical protein
VFVYSGAAGKFSVRGTIPGCILNDASVHISDIKTPIWSYGSVDEAGIEIGGSKEFFALRFGFAEHEFAIWVFHISPADHMNGGIAEKISTP